MTTTRGPWKLFLGPMDSIGIGPSASTIVCEMRRTRSSHWDSRELDARLIAAAPEMLEAIEHLVESLVAWYDPDGTDDVTAGRIHAANALLAKIEGTGHLGTAEEVTP